jgi:pre-rRNA-processing protein TSR1
MPRHRPGSLHQSNKRFKSKHASKGALKERNSGKVERSTGGGPKHQSTAAAQQKLNRKNAARMAQQRLRQQRVDQLRIFQGRSGAPRICAVIPLCADVSASRVVNDLFNDQVRAGMDCDITSDNRHRILDLTSRFKQKLQFIELDRPHDSTFYKHFLSVLDACKVADCVLFVVSAREDVDEYGKLLITAIRAQGVPSSLAIAEVGLHF